MLLGRFEECRVTNTNPELGSVRPTRRRRPQTLRPARARVPGERTDQGSEATLRDLSGAALRGGGCQARLFECSGYACYGCRSQGGISEPQIGGGGFRSACTGGVRGEI